MTTTRASGTRGVSARRVRDGEVQEKDDAPARRDDHGGADDAQLAHHPGPEHHDVPDEPFTAHDALPI